MFYPVLPSLDYLIGKKNVCVRGQHEEERMEISARGKVKWTDDNWTSLYYIDSGILT